MRRARVNVYVHFVWATQQRLPLVSPAIERRLYRYISGICRKHECPVLALGGMPVHVHLLVSLCSSISMAELMEAVKGASSRFAEAELTPGEPFGWQEGYGAFSVSPRGKKMVIDYVRD